MAPFSEHLSAQRRCSAAGLECNGKPVRWRPSGPERTATTDYADQYGAMLSSEIIPWRRLDLMSAAPSPER